MKALGFLIAILLAANLVSEAYSSNRNASEEPLITSAYKSCQLPLVLSRAKMDSLATELTEALMAGDADKFLSLHDKWPEPKTDAERKQMEQARKAASSFFSPGSIGAVREDSYQGFQYAGDSNGSEVFSIVYYLDAPNNDVFNRVFLRFHFLYDGEEMGLLKTEVKYQGSVK